MRACIIQGGVVINIVEYGAMPPNPPPGFGAGSIAVESNVANIGWTWNGVTLSNPMPPAPPAARQPIITIAAQARLLIEVDDIGGIQTAVNFAGAMLLDTGTYWVFFAEPQSDADYGALPQARGFDGILANVTDQTSDYVEITVTDRSGSPTIPTELFLSIQRAL